MLGDINPMASSDLGNRKASGGTVLIERKIIRSTDTASDIYFRNIPQDFNNLRIKGSLRSAGAVVTDNAYIQFNGDTSSTYYTVYHGYNTAGGGLVGGQTTTGGTSSYAARTAGNSAQAGFIGIFDLFIARYNDNYNANTGGAGGQYYRYWQTLSTFPTNVAGNTSTYTFTGFWGAVTPIYQIRLYGENSANFVHANVSLYGEI